MVSNEMTVDRVLSEPVRRRVADAVRDAEAGTSGEIVVVVVNAVDRYEEASWRGAALAASVVLGLDLLYRHATPFWWRLPVDAGLLAALLVGGIAFILVARVAPLRRMLVSRVRRRTLVRAAAHTAFRTHRVAATQGRTGVLVFVSLSECEVVVLPDAGLEPLAPEGAWTGVVERLVAGMRAGRPGEALVDGVRACGEVLRAAGCVAQPGDRNELEDAPR
jgi:putative membrane protein